MMESLLKEWGAGSDGIGEEGSPDDADIPDNDQINDMISINEEVTHSLTHLLTHSLTHSLTYSLTHSPTHSLRSVCFTRS